MGRNNGEFEINAKDLFLGLWSKKWLIIILGVIFALVFGFVSKFLLPEKYESSTKLYVMNWAEGSTVTYNDLQTAAQLAMDYQELILSRPVAQQVIENLDLDIIEEDFYDIISVTIPSDTRIITITAEYTDPHLVRDIANEVREIAISHISEVMNTSAVNVAEQANLPTEPSSPNIKLNILIGGCLGVLIASAIILIIQISDETVKTVEDVEKYVGMSVFVTIPLDKQKQKEAKRMQRLTLKRQRQYYEED